MATSGPTRGEIEEAPLTQPSPAGIQIIDVNEAVAHKLVKSQRQGLFSEFFPGSVHSGHAVGPGDMVEVSIWEAPPATLFGSTILDPRGGPATTRVTTFPEQMVNRQGMINVPFAGQVPAAGRSPHQIEAAIAQALAGKANQPQVLVRVTRNATSNVTVVGEVAASTRVPLTARGERLLDALAAAGGVRQPIGKTTLQLTRGKTVKSLPLDTIIRDPAQNIMLQPGDVVTALFQPYSFTVLGATGKNEEVNFEAQGISLTQALARAGGLNDNRADAKGAFLFRWEAAEALNWPTPPAQTPDGKVPVIYRVDLKEPATFLLAQSFAIKDKDVLFVSNAPSTELQKFLNLVMTLAYPMLNVINIVH
jgi:polysaccharide export outer membrane protein